MSERQTAQSAPSYALLTRLHAKASAGLAEAEAALAAVGASEVDALITRSGRQVELLTLPEPDSHPEFFRTLVAAMQEGAASLDAGGTVLYANARLVELLAIPLERIVGRALGELAADVSGPEVRRLLAQASRGPARTSLELRRGDGRTMPVEVSAAPLLAGERGELCLLVTDVTLKRLGEARLRRERAALDQAQAIGGVGSWEWDLDSGESRWSAEQFRLHGLDPAGVAPPQQEYAARVHPEDRAALLASWADHGRQRQEGVDEYRYEHPTLGTRTLRMHSDFLAAQADDGQRARLAGTCQDVTDERAAQSALQAAEERFRCSFDEARIGMMIIDLDGHYSCVNDAFCAIVGYSHERLSRLPRENITHPDDVAADAAAVMSLLANETTSHSCEKRYLHASGHTVWAAINLTLIRDAAGQPLHFIAQVQDITGRRSHERQLEHMADHDPLTDLLNRRSFARELSSHSARIARYGATGAVLMLDLDNFKYYNDTRGHSAGDALIVRIAQGLKSQLRDSDVLARLGGDEFAVLLPHDDDDDASQIVAEKLLHLVRAQTVPMQQGEHKRVTASVGIARFDDGPRPTEDEIMVNADLAMYDAKEAGGDRWARYRT